VTPLLSCELTVTPALAGEVTVTPLLDTDLEVDRCDYDRAA
jgi:hypothetical protein